MIASMGASPIKAPKGLINVNIVKSSRIYFANFLIISANCKRSNRRRILGQPWFSESGIGVRAVVLTGWLRSLDRQKIG